MFGSIFATTEKAGSAACRLLEPDHMLPSRNQKFGARSSSLRAGRTLEDPRLVPLLNLRNERICFVDVGNIAAVFQTGHVLAAISNEESSCRCVCEWPSVDHLVPWTDAAHDDDEDDDDLYFRKRQETLRSSFNALDCGSCASKPPATDSMHLAAQTSGSFESAPASPQSSRTAASLSDFRSSLHTSASERAASSMGEPEAAWQRMLPEGPNAHCFLRLAGNPAAAFEKLFESFPQMFERVFVAAGSMKIPLAVNLERIVDCEHLQDGQVRIDFGPAGLFAPGNSLQRVQIISNSFLYGKFDEIDL